MILTFTLNVVELLKASIYLFALCLLVRNDRVCRFQCRLIDLADSEEARKLADKYSYEEMVFSMKPLRLKYWYTEEEIQILKGADK